MDIVTIITGGWAGLRTVSTLDTDTLPPEDRRRAEAMVDGCLSHAQPPDDRARDARTITVSHGNRSVSFQEGRAPEAWSGLMATMPPGRIEARDPSRP